MQSPKTVVSRRMDTSFGIATTAAGRIEARTDPWDPRRPGAEVSSAFAEAQNALHRGRGSNSPSHRLDSQTRCGSVAMPIKQRGLIAARTASRQDRQDHHCPGGRQVYCGSNLLKRAVREVHRADLIGQHIGETGRNQRVHHDSADEVRCSRDEARLVPTPERLRFGDIDTLL